MGVSQIITGQTCETVEGMPHFYQYSLEKMWQEGAEYGYKYKENEWHDLRKAPNDLPKKDCEIITLHKDGNKNIQKWKNGNWTNSIVIPVIAWCEIPTFTDKE